MKNRMLAAVTMTVATLLAKTPPARAAKLVADYRFHGNLESDVQPAPDLSVVGPAPGCFAVGKVGDQLRTLLAFPMGNGVDFQPAAPTIASDRYTVAVELHFDVTGGYRRILSFDGGVADCGLYLLNGLLDFYCVTGGALAAPASGFTLVTMTRAGDGTVTAYIDGQQAFTFSDTSAAAVIGANDSLRFFRDNECPGACTEDSSGQAARIRIYDDALTSEEVAALSTPLDTTTTTLEVTCGDPNSSGTITAADALAALRAAVGTGCCLNLCDVNDSGDVTASDALVILKKAVGQPATLACPL